MEFERGVWVLDNLHIAHSESREDIVKYDLNWRC